jgi:archaellum biogenesis protein FlaJ (TadC family)
MESMTSKRRMSTRKTVGIIAACTLAMMNNIASGTAMAVTLPDIGKDLNIPAVNLQWIISAYTLTSVRCANSLSSWFWRYRDAYFTSSFPFSPTLCCV